MYTNILTPHGKHDLLFAAQRISPKSSWRLSHVSPSRDQSQMAGDAPPTERIMPVWESAASIVHVVLTGNGMHRSRYTLMIFC